MEQAHLEIAEHEVPRSLGELTAISRAARSGETARGRYRTACYPYLISRTHGSFDRSLVECNARTRAMNCKACSLPL
jgi:hypothetical protein